MSIDDWLEESDRRARVEKRLAAALKRGFGLSLLDYRALRAVAAAEEGELRLRTLARVLDVNQSSITRMMPRLESLGYAYRDLCPDDNRGAYCVITEKGREASSAMAEVLDRTLSEPAAALS
ncbi:MarR family winged helix-turn-helix transcriptional regulator [Glycomyces buryatensis]|uniref:MarR family transcriptional regulator n=1 Tax=Glycomyces buryatensis TaxID=2570927 RepID=A0A4S8Q901_9ACTN|nr:MarR family transcriptional regulator [Glycomyces buryatensis]THV40670.1 MarR family transcriptional regulator [Glycomyces buryatensis]